MSTVQTNVERKIFLVQVNFIHSNGPYWGHDFFFFFIFIVERVDENDTRINRGNHKN